MVLQQPASGLAAIRRRIGDGLFGVVAGPHGDRDRSRIHDTPGPRWFTPDRPIRVVHGDASMFVGGLRALLLQSLHPLAMAAVAEHSGYRGDPWGRLQRTSLFLAMTTYGTAADASRAVAAVQAVHRRVHGVAPDGRHYEAGDPHLLRWVHLAEVDSFICCHQRFGARRLDDPGYDEYVADMAVVAREMGVADPPVNRGELAEQLASYRPELRGTREAREAARFMLVRTPMPLYARPPYALLAATAVSTLPAWARWPLRLPYLPVAEATAVRLAGKTIIGGIRWVMTG
ncbi:MAG TPA: oxygenase MpaB family protein [Pseudonocardiaceae bacterium]|nr:oxygenase MpaB family protein [Pseudonocardiaceae bacterium]